MQTTGTYEITEVLPMSGQGSRRGDQGWCGTVEYRDRGQSVVTYFVSKWNGESQWIIDGQFHNNLPIFYNGQGSRVTILKTFKDETVGRELDDRVRQQTGW